MQGERMIEKKIAAFLLYDQISALKYCMCAHHTGVRTRFDCFVVATNSTQVQNVSLLFSLKPKQKLWIVSFIK